MSIRAELLRLVARARQAAALPRVRRVYVPEPEPSPDRDTEFGLIELVDRSVGLYYAWLGESQQGMRARFASDALVGADPADIAELYAADTDAERSLGLAAINAITQSVFRRAGLTRTAAANSMGGLDLEPGDHLGMIGNFRSLVRQARAVGARVTVVERKPDMVADDGDVRVTLDPAALRDCNKVISTAATLINDSLDGMLPYCAAARMIVVVGPTAGFFPDPLFARGIDVIGGTEIIDADLAFERLRQRLNLGASARRFALSKPDYPGFDALLARASR